MLVKNSREEQVYMSLEIALVGDHDAAVPAHQAIPVALSLAAEVLGVAVQPCWVPTDEIVSPKRLHGYHGIWCVPASPYRNMDGALAAIRYAREEGIPFLGTCGGFQHAVIEYARNVIGWHDANHAETSHGGRLVVNALACSLVETRDDVDFLSGSRLARIYGRDSVEEGYRCRYGLNPAYQAEFFKSDFRIAAIDRAGEVRAIEHRSHPFFIATLFQPERAALEKRLPPLVRAFVDTCRSS
jgi:CTP synthase (UTP-ammonia lyase)